MLENNNNNFYEDQNVPPQPQCPPQYVQAPYQQPIYVQPVVMQNPEEYKRKRDLRRIGLAIGLPAISLSVIGFLWSFVYLFVTKRFFGMSYNEAAELLDNPAMQQVLQIILSCLMFLIPFTIGAKCLKVKISNLIMFNKAKKGTFLPFLLFGIGFCSFSNVATSYASGYISSFLEFLGINAEYNVDFGANPEGIFGFLLSFITTAIVPALVEEFACRGIVLGMLKKYGEGFAIVSSSIIFGVMHGNFEQIPFATLVGFILGYIYVKTKSIWVCVAVHGINNAISVIFTYLSGVVSVNTQNLLYLIYLIISMLAAIVGVLLFAKNSDEKYALDKIDEKITEKQKYTWLFTSWAIIVFLCLNAFEAFTYSSFYAKIIQFINGY